MEFTLFLKFFLFITLLLNSFNVMPQTANKIQRISVNSSNSLKSETKYGIGVGLDKKDDKLLIIFVDKNSPAEKSGLKPGDFILSINDETVSFENGQNFNNLIDKISGPKNSYVNLFIQRQINSTNNFISNTGNKSNIKVFNIKIARELPLDLNQDNVEEFEITPKWIELSLKKNQLEKNIIENEKFVESIRDNIDFCLIHNEAHKNHMIVWYEEHQQIIREMQELKEFLIFNKTSKLKLEEEEESKKYNVYRFFPFKSILEIENYPLIKSYLQAKHKAELLEKKNKTLYDIAVNHSENKRFEEAIIALKKITKNYSNYNKVINYMAMNKRKLSQQKEQERIWLKVIKIRENFAHRLEMVFLDKGLDTNVTVDGENNEILRINYIFAGRVFANEFRKSNLASVVKSYGFEKVIFENDYSDDTYSITFKR